MKKNTHPDTSYMPKELQRHTKKVTISSPKRGHLHAKFTKFASSKFKKENTKGNIPSSFDLEKKSEHATVSSKKVLSPREKFTNEVKENLLVEAYKKEILFWSNIVYGNRDVFQREVQEILKNPAVGDELSQIVATFPEAIHPLAGKKLLCIKTRTRKNAEKGCKYLHIALKDYTRVAKNAEYFPYTSPHNHKQSIEKIEKIECLEKSLHAKKEEESHVRKKIASPQKNKEVSWRKNSMWIPSCLR
ncbi:BID domain-containing T4SS effector [Bartonella sp. B39]